MADPPRPRVFLDVKIGSKAAGRLVIELFTDKTPKTCENFRTLCTSSQPSLSYKNVPFHRIIDEFMVQGGDIKRGDGTGSVSIYGDEFDDENLDWREIDEVGLLCMANSGKNTNGSQFFITLTEECTHLNGIHTVFGRLVSGKDTLHQMAEVPVDRNDKPKSPVVISHCGELERRVKRPVMAERTISVSDRADESEDQRGRGKRRRSEAGLGESAYESEKSRRTHRHHDRPRKNRDSRSRSRGSRDHSTDKHKGRHRHRAEDRGHESDGAEGSYARRRSEFSLDHTLRGRSRRRSNSPNGKAVDKHKTSNGQDRENQSKDREHRRHHRSPSPSRAGRQPEDDAEEPGLRRRRSLPNQYHEWEKRERHHGKYRRDDRHSRGRLRDGEEDRLRAEEWEREGARDGDNSSGRLGGEDWDEADQGAVRYKGRGAMKYREKKRW